MRTVVHGGSFGGACRLSKVPFDKTGLDPRCRKRLGSIFLSVH